MPCRLSVAPPAVGARAIPLLCRRLAAAGLLAFALPANAEIDEVGDLIELPFSELVDVEIVSASKYRQRASQVPDNITVIDAAQIRGFGYRTLSDVLRSVPGLYISTDGAYDNVGVRGLTGAGVFNGRVLVLIDGYRLNETLFDSGTVGSEFPLDIDLIDRVEIIRGPASSIYGSNALYGVVNVITKKGRNYRGGEIAGAYGNFDHYKGRFTYGKKHRNGLEYLVSGTGFDSNGPTRYYPEFDSPATHNGRTDADSEDGRQVFTKASFGDFSLMGGWGRRRSGVPGGLFGTDFNDPAFRFDDSHAFAQLQYRKTLAQGLDFTGRAWYGDYAFDAAFPYGGQNQLQSNHANWSGFELRLLSARFDGQHLTAGIEVQKNWTQKQYSYTENPLRVSLDDRRNSHRIGIYLQDDIAVTDRINLSLGARFDDYSLVKERMFSPKIGLTWLPADATTLKLLYGSSFRAPTVWYQFNAYAPGFNGDGSVASPGQLASPNLKPESAETLQAGWEQKFGRAWLTRTTFYHIWLRDLFDVASVGGIVDSLGRPIYSQNINGASESAWGGEFELERHWANGALLRASYSLQYAQNRENERLFDSPQHLFKLNAMAPLFHPDWQGGFELVGLGPRDAPSGKTSGYVAANATLNWNLHRNVDFSASLYNIFDNDFADPRSDGIRVPASGRDFRLKLQVRF